MRAYARLLGLGVLIAACSDGGSPAQSVPGSITAAAGTDQVAEAGTVLPESLAVLVRTSEGGPLAGVTVSWSVATGGGSVSPATAVTGSNGIARAGRTLGPGAGPQTASATVAGLPAVTFGAVALIQGAMTLGDRSLGPLTDTVLGTLREIGPGEQPLKVIVMNHLNEPVPGVTVTWSASGGGSVSMTSDVTDAGGESIVEYTFGLEARDGYFASASVTGLVGSPVLFNMRAHPATPVALAKSGGDGLVVQTGGQVVHTVTTYDSYGNGAHGVTIAWALGSGGGSITPAQNVTADGGRAEATRTLGTGTGEQTVSATAAALPGTPSVQFTTIAATTVVRVANNAFISSGVAVQTGDSVAWQWQPGAASHNITFAAAAGAPADEPNRTSGAVWRTFPVAGSFAYQCTNHSGMTGTVTVGP
ncbi:MAG TPA: plastocyanin/azurin family copper-binding protein [Gemmatimonadales bacterium]|nr:plastocyanin/azurin family copper-binding protein [Gemmatimonadales bacterium]